MPSLTKVQTAFLEPQGAATLDPGTASAPGLRFSTSAATGMFSPSAGVLGFSTGSTQNALTILGSGNVGIGTTIPTSKLTVKSSTYNQSEDVVTSLSSTAGITILTSDTGSDVNGSNGAGIRFSQLWWSGSTDIVTTGAIYGYKRAPSGLFGGGLKFATSSAHQNYLETRMTIDDGGNVGIGTNSPTHKLVVYGTGAANEIRSSDGTVTSQWYQDSSGFGVFGTTSNHHQIFRTNGSEKMRISSGGYVGIGTSGPLDALHVHAAGFDIVGGNAINGQTMAGIKITNSQNTDSSVGLWFGTSTSHWSGISGQRSSYLSSWGTDLRFYTHEDATNDLTYTRERLRITSSGNVGIGITNPATKLETSLIVQGQGAERYTPVDVLSISADNPGATVYGGFGQGLVFRGRSYNVSTYRALGRILHRIWDDSINTTLGSSLEFQTSNNGSIAAEPTTKMTIGYNGNVGIGTTNPLAKLDVRGGILVKNVANGDGNSAIMIGSSVPDGDLTDTGVSIRTFVESAGVNGYALQFFTQQSYLTNQTEKVRITGPGNVGIGITNPNCRFQAQIQTTALVNGDTVNSYRIARFMNLSSDGAGRGIEFGAPTGSVTSPVYIKVVSTGARFSIVNQTDSENLTILDSGNVGIGIANPSYKLQVNGAVYGSSLVAGSLYTIRSASYTSVGSATFSWTFGTNGNSTLLVTAAGSHYGYSNFSCMRQSYVHVGPNFTETNLHNYTTGNHGSWTFSWSGNVLTVTHNAGSYAGGSEFWVSVEGV